MQTLAFSLKGREKPAPRARGSAHNLGPLTYREMLVKVTLDPHP